jgi:general secretion pathway protein I
MTSQRNAQGGFSLLEIIVAFTILSLSLGLLMQIFSSSLRNADLTRKQAQATALAQSLLAEAGIESPLVEGSTTGTIGSSFRWQTDVAPYREPVTSGEAEVVAAPPAVDLWQVNVRVSWGDGTESPERSVDLVTLRTQPIQPQ